MKWRKAVAIVWLGLLLGSIFFALLQSPAGRDALLAIGLTIGVLAAMLMTLWSVSELTTSDEVQDEIE